MKAEENIDYLIEFEHPKNELKWWNYLIRIVFFPILYPVYLLERWMEREKFS